MLQRVKEVQESDLRMLGNLARNIQRVLPVTQADIDAAAALGQGWVVWKVIEVNDPIDNLRGGTQLVIKQNSITPGQNVRRVLIVQGPGGETVVIGPGPSPLLLPDAIANSLSYVKAFGGTEQRNLPDGYIERQFIYMMDGSYLLTDIVPTYDGRVEIDFQTTSIPGAGVSVLGGRTTAPKGLNFGWSTDSYFLVDSFSSTRYTSTVMPTANTRYKFTFNNKNTTLESGGSVLFSNNSGGTQATGAALAINALNNNGTIGGNNAGIYLYSFKAWNAQGELIADYVPAVQKGTVPVVGFYDTVSGTFKTATAGTFAAGGEAVPTPDTPMDIISNNGALKANKNLYGTEYNGYELSQVDGITLRGNSGVNVSGMVDCRTIKSFKITTASPQDGFRIFKYRADNTYIDANSTASIGDIITLEDNVGFFRIQYNFTNSGTDTENVLIYNSAYDLNSIYADGTVETINIHGKNLFDVNNVTIQADTSIGSDGSLTPNVATKVCMTYLPVKPNTTYTISGDVLGSNTAFFRLAQYKSDKTFLGRSPDSTGQRSTYTFTTGADTYFVRFHCITEANLNTYQLELGSTATTYENYFNGGTATAEMLLKVGNYEDVQSIIDGVVTRNVGVKVLDGTEDWDYQTQVPSVMTIKSVVFPADFYSNPNNNVGYCNYYTVVATSTSLSSVLTSGQMGWNTIGNIMFKWTESGASGVASFKQFLADQYAAGTPVTIVYPLATPTTETVTGQTMQVQQGDNFVEITQASLDNLEIEAKYKKQA